jgi:hypothetical protein
MDLNKLAQELGGQPVTDLDSLASELGGQVASTPGGYGAGTVATDVGKLVSAGAVKGVAGAPETVQAVASETGRSTLFGPTEALNLIADPRRLANKLVGAVGLPPVFEVTKEQPLVPAEVTEKQKAAVNETLAKGKVPQLRQLTEYGNKLSQDIENTVSPEMRLAMAESQPTGNIIKALETGDFSELSMGKNPTALGLTGQAVKVFGSSAPALLVAMVTKSAGPATAVGFGQAGAEGIDEARNYVKGMSDEELAKQSEYFRNLITLGYSPKDARLMTEDKAADTAALYQGSVGALGSAFTTKLIQGGFDKALLGNVKSRLGKIVQGTAIAGTEGALTEAAEGVATDLGINKTIVREIGVDSFANLVLGAIGEAAPGVIRGAVAPGEAVKGAEAPESKATPEAAPAVAPAVPPAIITDEAIEAEEGLTPVSPSPTTVAPEAATVPPTPTPPIPAAPTAEIAQRIEELDAELKAIDSAYDSATPEQFTELNARQGEIKSEIARLFRAGTTGAPVAAAPTVTPVAPEVVAPAAATPTAEVIEEPLKTLDSTNPENIKKVEEIAAKLQNNEDVSREEDDFRSAVMRDVMTKEEKLKSPTISKKSVIPHATIEVAPFAGGYVSSFAYNEFKKGLGVGTPLDISTVYPTRQEAIDAVAKEIRDRAEQDGNKIALKWLDTVATPVSAPAKAKTQAEINRERQAEKKAAAEKAKQPVDTSGVKDLIEGKIKKVLGWTVYKRKEDPEFWYVQNPANHAENRIGQGDDVSTNLDTARSRIEQHIADAEYDARKSAEKPAEVAPKIEDIVSPEVAASMKDLEFQNRLIKANKEKTITERQFSKLFKLYQDGKTPQADEQLTQMLAKNEKKAKAEEEPEEVTGTELKESESKSISAQEIFQTGNKISNIRYAQDGKIAFTFNGQDFLIKEPSDVILVGTDQNLARKWIAKRYGFLLEPFTITKETHIEGKKSEPVTTKTIEEAIDKAESNVDSKKIKTAIKNQFDQAIKRAKIQTEKEWAEAKGLLPAEKFVTISVPGDGQFKVKNNVERLKEFQTKMVNATTLKGPTVQGGPSSGAIEAFKGMVDDKDMENAIEYAKLKGLDPKTVKLNPAQRSTVDKYLKNPAEFERQQEESEQMAEARQTALRADQEKRTRERLEADEKREEEARFKAVLDTTIRSTESQLKADINKRKLSSKDAERMLDVFSDMPEGTVKPYTIKALRNFVTPKTEPSTVKAEVKPKAPSKKEKETAYKQILKDLLGVNVGDVVTFNQDIEYASKDTPYTITAAGEKTFGIYNPANDSRTTINYSTAIRQKSRGLVANKVEEKTEEYTPEQRENAEQHAKDLGGEVAYQNGDIALIRGYSILTGAPKYAVAKGTERSNIEVGAYLGNLITAAEKAKLVQIVEQLEKDAQQKHKEDPYIKFENGIALSKDINSDLAGVIKEWKRLLGLKANIYVTTIENAKQNKNNFTGPHRVIGSSTLSDLEAGNMRRMPDNSYYVTFEKSTSKTKMLEIIAHELGHVHEREVFLLQPDEMKIKIRGEFDKWLLSQKGKTARELVNSLRAKSSARNTELPAGMKAEKLSPYWKSFGEWYADQVSRWATTTDKPLTAVEKFFQRLGNQMRRFYGLLKNAGYLPNETFKQYLDTAAENQEMPPLRGEDSDFAPEAMVKKIEPLPKDELVESLLEKHNRPEAPRKPSLSVRDAFMGGYDNTKETVKDVLASPLIATNNMIGKADRALTYFRNKNIFFGYGLEEADRQRYSGQVRNAHQQAIASLAVVNALHSGNIATQVMTQGKLVFDKDIQMFIAEKSDKSMANVVREKAALIDKLGFETGNRVIQSYFEAKRSRSIVNEYLNREAAYEAAIESGQKEEEARRDLANIEKAVEKVNMDDEAIDDFISLENQYPELRKMMDNWTAVNQNMIDMMEFSGIISKQRAKSLRSIKDYVPWYRIMDDQEDIHSAPKNTRGLTNVAADKKFGPGKTERDIDDIVDNMIHNVLTITRNSARNYAANRVVMEYGDRYTEGKNAGKLRVFPSEGSDADGVRFNIIAAGRRIVVRIKDPLVAEAVIGMENIDIPMNGALAFMANTLRRSITTFPAFQVAQLFMDAPTAALVTGLKNPAAVWSGVFTSFLKNLRKDDPIVAKLRAAGIGGYQSSARTPEKEIQLDIGLIQGSWFSKAMKGLDRFGDASDYAQRRSVYLQTMKETGDEMLALFQANNVIDFKKRGSGQIAQLVTKQVAFMNAYAQAIDVLAKGLAGTGLKGIDRKKALARMATTAMLLSSATLVYCMLVGDDDEYNKLDDQTKMRTIFIPGLDIRLPMHSGAAFFFKAIPELIYNAIMKEGTKDEYDKKRLTRALGKAAVDSLLGPNPTPTGVKPVVEILLNRNFFTGGQVTPRGMEDLAAYRQYNQNTSELGKIISALTGTEKTRLLNPIEADHLVRGLTGTIGAAVMWGTNLLSSERPTPQAKDNPFYGQFIMPDVPRGREDLYYDLKSKTDQAYKTYMDLQKKQRKEEAAEWFKENKPLIQVYGYTSSIEADLKRLNGEIRRLSDLPSEKMSPDAKRKRMTELQEIKGRILKDVISMRKRAGLDESYF